VPIPSVASTDKRDRALAVAILLAFLTGVFGFLQLSAMQFFAYAVGGAFLIHITTSVRPAEWLPAIALAPALAFFYHVSGGRFGTAADAAPANVMAFLGLGSCFLLGWKAIRGAKSLAPFLAAMTIPLCALVTGLLLCVLVQFQPKIYDFYLYRFDASLGGQASAIVGRWFKHLPLLAGICVMSYEALPLAQCALLSSYLRDRRSLRHFFLTVGLAGVAGCALYQTCP
jgi:hypothetical protein